MKVAIMQPYTFPYIGYFHLIHASNQFVFYDDVNFIKRGWVNRNRILINGGDHLFSIPISNASQNRLINETKLIIDDHWIEKFQKTLVQSYQKAPHFSVVSGMVVSVLSTACTSIADMAINSIISVCGYLDIDFKYSRSSILSPETRGLGKADRLIEITKKLGGTTYLNPIGGTDLYNREYFQQRGVKLGFVASEPVQYSQYGQTFVPSLSIIDVLMFNDPNAIKEFLNMHSIE